MPNFVRIRYTSTSCYIGERYVHYLEYVRVLQILPYALLLTAYLSLYTLGGEIYTTRYQVFNRKLREAQSGTIAGGPTQAMRENKPSELLLRGVYVRVRTRRRRRLLVWPPRRDCCSTEASLLHVNPDAAATCKLDT